MFVLRCAVSAAAAVRIDWPTYEEWYFIQMMNNCCQPVIILERSRLVNCWQACWYCLWSIDEKLIQQFKLKPQCRNQDENVRLKFVHQLSDLFEQSISCLFKFLIFDNWTYFDTYSSSITLIYLDESGCDVESEHPALVTVAQNSLRQLLLVFYWSSC